MILGIYIYICVTYVYNIYAHARPHTCARLTARVARAKWERDGRASTLTSPERLDATEAPARNHRNIFDIRPYARERSAHNGRFWTSCVCMKMLTYRQFLQRFYLYRLLINLSDTKNGYDF